MVEWCVQLTGDDYNLKYLTKILNSSTLSVTNKNDEFYLTSSYFNNLKNFDEVSSTATDIVKNAGKSIDAERKWQNEQLPLEIKELVLTARKAKRFEKI
jgi:serine protease inhibitor